MKNILFLIALFFAAVGVTAQEDNVRQKHYNLGKNELALEGYDPVSYFTVKKPTKGNQKYSYTYKFVNYHFSNEINKKEFAKNPEKYEPAYGGWCALAIAKNGEKVAVDPLAYKIKDGKLLLFYKATFYNALTNWNKDKTSETDRLKKGDVYWEEIIKK